MATIAELQAEIDKQKAEYLSEVLKVLQKDPEAEERWKNYDALPEYLREIQNGEFPNAGEGGFLSNLLHVFEVGMEK